ncbi:MAG: hypothetical protein BEN19_04245 [Epulopiscium sp. Nuni2H_MBin003]|nr:MAG: hypothetical protein BEN19_04245 [Epulopiscium sp. Nuni2H_MBin003]
MSVELIKKWMDVTETTMGASTQIVKEKDLIVPDGKPDMQKVLLLDGKIRMDQIDVQSNRIVYKGQIDVTILYTPENQNFGIVKMTGTVPIEDFMIVDNLESDDRVDFSFDIENMHYNILNERKINIKAIIALHANITSKKEVSMVEDLSTDVPVQKKTQILDVINMMPIKEEKKIIKDELTIPQNKPAIEEILKQNTTIVEEQIKRTDDAFVFNGMIEVTTLYKSNDDENSLEVASHKIPFSGTVDIARDDNEVYLDCDLDVSPTYIQVNPDYDGEDRVIEIECIVTAKYTTYNNDKSEVLDDIYCPGKKVNIDSTTEPYMNLAFKENDVLPKKATLDTEGINPDTNKIFAVESTAKVEDKVLDGSTLTVEGIVEVNVVYVSEEEKVSTYEDMLPFEISINTNLPEGNYIINAEVTAKDMSVSSFNKDNISLDYSLDYSINVYEQKEIKIIEDISFEDMSKEELSAYPSIIVYTVKAGENLWDLAKRFNTTVEEIAEVNEFDTSYQPKSGEKVIIIKKTKF